MTTAPVVAFVALGGNVGDVPHTIGQAFAALDALPGSRLLRTSSLYRTPAWGVQDQPDFVNAVAALRTTLGASELMRALLAIERDHGRDRASETRWGPRSLDLDLLLYGATRLAQDDLSLPHPRMHERAFVMLPLAEIAPDVEIPGRGRVASIAAALCTDGIHALSTA